MVHFRCGYPKEESQSLLAGSEESTIVKIREGKFGIRRGNWNLIIAACFVIVVALSSVIFMVLEGSEQRNQYHKSRQFRQSLHNDSKCQSIIEKDQFIDSVIQGYSRGMLTLNDGNATDDHTWTFVQSLFFVTTILTTVGYGNMAPVTQMGKLYCIVLACLGIPLTLMVVTSIADRFKPPIDWLLAVMKLRFENHLNIAIIELIHLLTVSSLFGAIFVFIPAAFFVMTEPTWTYIDAVYYCIISVTAVGLGDHVLGQGSTEPKLTINRIGVIVYIFFGVTCAMVVLNTFSNESHLYSGHLLHLNSDTVQIEKNKSIPATYQKTDKSKYVPENYELIL